MVSVVEKAFDGNSGAVRLHGCSEPLANALRHAMMRDVECPAVVTVRVIKNTSIFPDDFIAHRCGQIPLRGPPSGTLRLRATGPGRALSSSIESATHDVADGEIIVASLGPSAELDLEMRVESATGATHARHCAAVAPRFTWRTRGVDYPECFCEGAAHGCKCEECGLRKRPDALRDAPRDILFQFETTGARSAEELFSDSIASLRAIVQAVGA